jgi:hypothetical protein
MKLFRRRGLVGRPQSCGLYRGGEALVLCTMVRGKGVLGRERVFDVLPVDTAAASLGVRIRECWQANEYDVDVPLAVARKWRQELFAGVEHLPRRHSSGTSHTRPSAGTTVAS